MSETFEKPIRNGSYVSFVTFLISFFYGGIYNEIIIEGIKFSLENILYALIGSIFVGIIIFIPTFILSLIIYYFIKKIKEDRGK